MLLTFRFRIRPDTALHDGYVASTGITHWTVVLHSLADISASIIPEAFVRDQRSGRRALTKAVRILFLRSGTGIFNGFSGMGSLLAFVLNCGYIIWYV